MDAHELSQALQLLEQLHLLLENETACLKAGQMQDLQHIASQKMRCFAQVEQMKSASPALLRNTLRSVPGRALLEEILRKNQLNGQIIQALMRFNQGAWEIFFGNSQPLYTDLGTARSAPASHLIGSA
ncbi:flagellar export chaperone FlgN [Acidithiobacillus montserratensis]|uniref:Flagellar export chaperone FlgN n=1 Tax=Acidithiobacillus montserratensis TaxID=2729135 RepID=A0ACD5HIC5_9PROT|nr:flagellar export chaperone FlgN [Acidithiobacillus montserratensis]MBN2680526.1 flagellar export chaperone FlgN [Acidithiobacillaceae bacterium]MBU2747076.1 flagellar protein FlgN [Acidithiobacillus montserratensis]